MDYYNENDPKMVAWLRSLISEGHLPAGYVDDRSIENVQPDDITGFVQCHFFAGIGGWSLALRIAGWPETQTVWTGSCPCQPFSAAGKRTGESDKRHLWPEFRRLIEKRHPSTIFGEQVASKLGREWFSRVRVDLEGMGYGVGGADLCAASKALPHPRQRLFWAGHANSERNLRIQRPGSGRASAIPTIWQSEKIQQAGQGRVNELVARRIAKRIPTYAEAVSVLDGIPNRVALMRGASNAIVPQVAAEFVRAYMQIMPASTAGTGAGSGT